MDNEGMAMAGGGADGGSSLFNQETMQQRLQMVIEGARESWTYAIFWQLWPDAAGAASGGGGALFNWGDGYFNGTPEGSTTSAPAVRSQENATLAPQELRKKVLRELHALIEGSEPGASAADISVDGEVTDAEWFYLVSMMHSFAACEGVAGQAFASGAPAWVSGAHRLEACPCPRAKQASQFGIHTMVCIPTPNGVVELGSVLLLPESWALVQHVKNSFTFSSSSIASWGS